MADIVTRVYVMLGDTKATDSYFRVSSGGVYDRWNATNRTWDHVTNPILRDFYTTGDHHGGRPRRIASVSMKMPLQVGQRHARERRPCGCIAVPSFGHCQAGCVSSVMT